MCIYCCFYSPIYILFYTNIYLRFLIYNISTHHYSLIRYMLINIKPFTNQKLFPPLPYVPTLNTLTVYATSSSLHRGNLPFSNPRVIYISFQIPILNHANPHLSYVVQQTMYSSSSCSIFISQ